MFDTKEAKLMKVGEHIQKFLVLCIACLTLGGCMSTAGEWFSFSSTELAHSQNNDENARTNNRAYQKNGKMQSKAMLNTIANAKVEETDKKLETLIKEWDAVKSDINRIIELEAELGFIVDELTKQDSLNSLHKENIALAQYTPESMPEVNSGDPIRSDRDFAPPEQERNRENTTIVGQAAAIINMDNVIDVGTKFSAQASNLALNDPTSANTSETRLEQNKAMRMDNKFSQNTHTKQGISSYQTASIVGSLPSDNLMHNESNSLSTLSTNEGCKLASLDNSIGIHLISLKDEKKVNKAANQLLNKFSALLCGSYKVNNVVVKGEQYYSVRFGPYTNRQEAQKACSLIRAKGQYCGLADFVGQTM